eukprot:6673286-Prorocentrum_lima.AAC.1
MTSSLVGSEMCIRDREMEVFDEVTQEEAKDMRQEGSQVKRLPAILILVKKPSAQDHDLSLIHI